MRQILRRRRSSSHWLNTASCESKLFSSSSGRRDTILLTIVYLFYVIFVSSPFKDVQDTREGMVIASSALQLGTRRESVRVRVGSETLKRSLVFVDTRSCCARARDRNGVRDIIVARDASMRHRRSAGGSEVRRKCLSAIHIRRTKGFTAYNCRHPHSSHRARLSRRAIKYRSRARALRHALFSFAPPSKPS